MRKGSGKDTGDELRPEYDLSKLEGATWGKYYARARSATNLVLIEPDLAEAFPDPGSVNSALRLLLNVASAVASPRGRRRGIPRTRRRGRGAKAAARRG
jgi:hypothetical protein